MALTIISSGQFFDIAQASIKTPDGQTIDTRIAVTKEGELIGPLEMAEALIGMGCVEFFKVDPAAQFCTIGYNPASGAWHGWSLILHEKFNLNDLIFDANLVKEGIALKKSGTVTITSPEQAKEAATKFAVFAQTFKHPEVKQPA